MGRERGRWKPADDRLGRAHREPTKASRTGESAMFGGPLGDFDTEQADHRRSMNMGL